jgi:hypothetical protein
MAAFGAAIGLAPRARSLMLWTAIGCLVVGGAADMASSAFRNSMLMTVASDDVRGRLQGVFIVVVAGGPRIADIVHGGAAAAAGTAVTAAVGGLLVVVLLAVAVASVPAFLQYTPSRSTPGTDSH